MCRSRRPLTLASLLVLHGLAQGQTESEGAPDTELQAVEPATGYDDGFFIRSADGDSEFRIGGLFQVVASYTPEREPASDFVVKRMRPELSGRFDALRFLLEPNFDEDGVELEEAWLGTELFRGQDLLMLGRMKVPFNLEEVRSRTYIDFPTFSIMNQFAPAEENGAFLYGESPSGRWEYNAALYSASDGLDNVAARLMLHPFVESTDSRFLNLQLGVSATLGSQEEAVGGDTIENEIGLPVIEFAPGVTLDGRQERIGAEVAWFHGPWFLQSEYMVVRQEMSSSSADGEVDFSGGYLTLSRTLTGEAKSFAGVSPDSPFDFRTGRGRGAYVLALRLSQLHIDEDAESLGFVVPATFTDRIRTVSLGLDWIANRHVMVRTAWVQSFYADEVLLDGGSEDRESALLVEFQLHF
ncbi:MAG: hypothetical protein CMJ89_03940 [Planctomycetes bacterium]|nr:hypothetical protein [Planctomycetota bacterium]